MKNSKTSLKMLPPVSQLLSALDAVPSYIYIKDRHSRYIYANKHTLMLFGCSLTELIGRSDDQFFPPNVVVHLKAIDQRVLQGERTEEEIVDEESDGHSRVYLEVKTPIYDSTQGDHPVGILGISTDISKQKQLEKEIRQLANTDSLTGLPNRRELFGRIQRAQLNSKRTESFFCLMFIDIDKFKAINDQYGHEAGDNLLVQVSKHLLKVVRETDVVSRIGGDEFVVLYEGLGKDKTQASEFASVISQKIRIAIGAAGEACGLSSRVTGSVGITIFRYDTVSASELLSRADAEMYKGKSCECQPKIDHL
ncbi:MAG TPA: GGDEF domain-containing protein [Thermodesulfobacteriota bacterium]|nr:GGDEF domain-containing protein [Thermodesulfobacteriota bacterium]